MLTEPQLLERRASEECGCPEELWLVGGVETTIHEEGDGTVHCFMDSGDAQCEVVLHSLGTLDAARPVALGWATAMLYSTTGWG